MFVYKITNIKDGKAYIGITTKTVDRRWKAHLSNAFVKNVHYYLYNAMRKHGKESFVVETLYAAESLEELKMVEKGLIAQYGTLSVSGGYNQSSGGEGRTGIKFNDAIKKEMAERTKKYFQSNPHPMLGKKHKAETKIKMSISAKLKPAITEETRKRLSIANFGRKMSFEAVEKGRLKRIGAKRTPEQIERIRRGLDCKRKYSLDLIEKTINFVKNGNSQAEAARLFGIRKSYISQLVSARR